jgi:ATP-dependent DNA ligase
VFSGTHVEGLIGTQTSLFNSTLIAELEAGTEAANKRNLGLTHRRLHVFDVIKLFNQVTINLSYEQRRSLLEQAFSTVLAGSSKLLLTKQTTHDFQAFFESVSKTDGEGLVLKRLGKPYKKHGSNGKTDDWIRCKRFRFVDYVVMSIGRSDSGSPNFQVGLYDGKKLTRVATIKNIPVGLDYHALVGKVIECKGAEIHDSGALRHGHYERTRCDKDPEECTFEAALNS